MIAQSDSIVKLHFEDQIFYNVTPSIIPFSDFNNDYKLLRKIIHQELPSGIMFFKYSEGNRAATVTDDFKRLVTKHRLKGFQYQLEYDSEAESN